MGLPQPQHSDAATVRHFILGRGDVRPAPRLDATPVTLDDEPASWHRRVAHSPGDPCDAPAFPLRRAYRTAKPIAAVPSITTSTPSGGLPPGWSAAAKTSF